MKWAILGIFVWSMVVIHDDARTTGGWIEAFIGAGWWTLCIAVFAAGMTRLEGRWKGEDQK